MDLKLKQYVDVKISAISAWFIKSLGYFLDSKIDNWTVKGAKKEILTVFEPGVAKTATSVMERTYLQEKEVFSIVNAKSIHSLHSFGLNTALSLMLFQQMACLSVYAPVND